jgi:ketosteroid isomerase-like protein
MTQPYMFVPAIFLLAAPVAAHWQARSETPSHESQILLRAINHRIVNSRYARIDDFAAKTVGSDFFAIGRDGEWLDREQYISVLREEQEQVEVYYEDVRMHDFGNSALIHAVATIVKQDGSKDHIRYTDVYVRSDVWWRLVASQETILAATSAISQNKGEMFDIVPWNGRDPEGDDASILQILNDQYVDAFRRADVSWYAAHLAPDYVVTSGDGSFDDRAAALADFAIPYFDKNIASFPVDDVKIRRFGDIAIIHAENDYVLKGGRKGVNRYTDIWRKTGNRWQCVSAHITVHKTPQ